MAYTYSINGIDLDRWDVMLGTTHQLGATMARSVVSVPGMDGEIISGRSAAEAPLLTLVLDPKKTATTTLDAAVDDLATLLSAPTITVQRITTGSTRQAVGVLVGHTWDPNMFYTDQLSSVSITLSIPGVWWRDTATADSTLVAGSNTLTTAVGSAPITDAIIRFALDAANPSLTDVATGTGISVAYDATAAEYIFVDVDQLQAWKSTSSSQWTRPGSGLLDSSVSYPGPGPLRISPVLTAVRREAVLTSSHAAVARLRKAWW